MHLSLDMPKREIFSIIVKLLEDKALEDGEEYEYNPIEAEGSPQFSTPKKGEEPFIPQLVKHFKSLHTSELKQIVTAISRKWMSDMIHMEVLLNLMPQDLNIKMCPPYFIALPKEGTLRTNIPKLSVFTGERLKGEASFEQWL